MKYVKPEMEILKFEKGDVIKTSDPQLGNAGNYNPNDGGSDHEGWIPNNY